MTYEFTEDWHSHAIPIWREVFKKFCPRPDRILEVGSFEGRAATWLIDNVAPREMVCIDSWTGGIEHAENDMTAVEARFDRNLGTCLRSRQDTTFRKIKSLSHPALARMVADSEQFDFIYLDGGHDVQTVLTDAVLATHLCKPGGIICCDDFIWRWSDDHSPLVCPKMAIDAVVNCNYGRFRVIMGIPLYQLFLLKIP